MINRGTTLSKSINKEKGFTLIELSIVLLIIGVLIGSFIGTLTTRIENMRVAETREELEQIKTALIGYAYTHGYLPCPDCIAPLCGGGSFRDGTADWTGSSCSVGAATGTLPWVSLGLAEDDAWSTRYRYWVSPTFADKGTPFTLTDAAAGTIRNRNNADAIQPLADRVVAVVFSHGKNRLGGFSRDGVFQGAVLPAHLDERENVDDDAVFVSRPPTTEEATTVGGEFDDVVDWISEFELKARMVEAGKPPLP